MTSGPDLFYIPPQKEVGSEFMAHGNCGTGRFEFDDGQVVVGVKEMINVMYVQTSPEIRRAKQVCRDCPVKQECLEYALSPPFEKWGVWAETSEKERRTIRKKRQSYQGMKRGVRR